MSNFNCIECGHYCKVIILDKKIPPEFCLVDGTEVTWVVTTAPKQKEKEEPNDKH